MQISNMHFIKFKRGSRAAIASFLLAWSVSADVDNLSDSLPLRAPAYPLVVNDPFFSLWSQTDELASSSTVHWTAVFGNNGVKAVDVTALIDSRVYRLVGPCPADAPALPQVGLPRVYPATTVVQYAGAGVTVTLNFSTPVFGDGADRGSGLPLAFITATAASSDGRAHDVRVLVSAAGQLGVNTASQGVAWSRMSGLSTPGAVGLSIGTSSQTPWDGYGDDFRIDWGHAILAAAGSSAVPVAAAAASANVLRSVFAANGTLPSADERAMPVPACSALNSFICKCGPGLTGDLNDWPAVGVAFYLTPLAASPPAASATAVAVLAYDDGDRQSIRFFGHPQTAYWRSTGRTIDQLVDHALANSSAILLAIGEGDAGVVAALRAAAPGTDHDPLAAERYERLASLSYRQALGANKQTWYDGSFRSQTPPSLQMWVKGCASSGDTGTLDDNLPAVPFLLWTQPELVPAFLRPLFMWAAGETYAGPSAPFPLNMTFDFPFAPHYLGQYPDAELQCWNYPAGNNCEQMPLEMSASAISIVAAHALQTNDTSLAEAYWPQLEQWAQYLVDNGLYPGLQRSSDDYEGFIANSTHLALKAIVGLGSYAQLANATGRSADGAAAWSTALAMRDTWMQLALDPTSNATGKHYMLAYGAPGTASIKYSLIFDVGLGLGLFTDVIADECTFLEKTAQPYGWVLQLAANNSNTWSNTGWEGFTSGYCPDDSGGALVARMFAFANTTQPRNPMTDWYDAGNAQYVGFTARAQVGGLYSRMWLQHMRELAAARAAGTAPPVSAAVAARQAVHAAVRCPPA